jgi:malonyl-CoA O-methyltransferase
MEQRLQWIRIPPQAWCHWDPVRGGLQAHALVRARYPQALCHVVETAPHLQPVAAKALAPAWWSASRWKGAGVRFEAPAPGSVQMLWANMALHMAADPQALIAQWQKALSVDGYLMFSCLGPDTLRELRALYAAMDWPGLVTPSPTCTIGATC